MNKTLLIMQAEIGASLRRRTFLFFAFGLPIMAGLIALLIVLLNQDAGAPAATPATPPAAAAEREGYVDNAGIIAALPADLPAGRLVPFPDRAAADAAMRAGEIDAFYVVPAEYLRSGAITYVTPTHSPLGGDVPFEAMYWALQVNLLAGDAELAAAIAEPLLVAESPLEPAQAAAGEESELVEIFPILMVLALYISIIVPAGGLISALTDEKKNQVMEVLLTSASTRQIIAGKVLALGLLGLAQTVVWVGILWAVMTFGGRPLNIPVGFRVPPALLAWSLVYFLFGYAMYGAMQAGVGALASDIKESRTASFIMLSPLVVCYIVMTPLLAWPNAPWAVAFSLFPLTSPVAMIARLAVVEVPFWQPAVAALLQAGAAVAIGRLAARLFRAQHLLAGQPFSLRSYYRALLAR